MKRQVLWQLSIVTSPRVERATAQLLADRFGQSPAIYTDVQKGKTEVVAYLQTKPDWSIAARAGLMGALRQLAGLAAGDAKPRLSLKRLQPQDWTQSWKRHFKPLLIRHRLLVKPTWSRRRPKRGQVQVLLDPGLSFGTGQHPTTSFCLGEITRYRRPKLAQSLLDIGTGSGILAIAAAKLGYDLVHAFDLDPESIRVARSNARLNRLSETIRFQCQDLSASPLHPQRRFSIVCANLVAELLVAQIARILARLSPQGLLVLAGILASEFPRLQTVYEGAGLRLLRSRMEREWRSGSFIRARPY